MITRKKVNNFLYHLHTLVSWILIWPLLLCKEIYEWLKEDDNLFVDVGFLRSLGLGGTILYWIAVITRVVVSLIQAVYC